MSKWKVGSLSGNVIYDEEGKIVARFERDCDAQECVKAQNFWRSSTSELNVKNTRLEDENKKLKDENKNLKDANDQINNLCNRQSKQLDDKSRQIQKLNESIRDLENQIYYYKSDFNNFTNSQSGFLKQIHDLTKERDEWKNAEKIARHKLNEIQKIMSSYISFRPLREDITFPVDEKELLNALEGKSIGTLEQWRDIAQGRQGEICKLKDEISFLKMRLENQKANIKYYQDKFKRIKLEMERNANEGCG